MFRRGSSASVTSGKTRKSSNAGREFFTISDFVEWRKTISDEEASKYTVKYYKGLGTSTAAEGKEYFRNLSRHRIRFHYASEVDAALLQLAFSKKKVRDGKQGTSQCFSSRLFFEFSSVFFHLEMKGVKFNFDQYLFFMDFL